MSRRWVVHLFLAGVLAMGLVGAAEAQLTAHFRAEQIDYDAAQGDCDTCVFCTPTCELYFAMGIWAGGSQQGSTQFFPGSCSSYAHADGILDFPDHEISESIPDLASEASFYFGLHDEDPNTDLDDLLGTHHFTKSGPTTNSWDSSNNNLLPAQFTPLSCDAGGLDHQDISGRFGLRYSVWFTDDSGPSTPGHPAHSDTSANTGWDDDSTLDFSWSAASDPHSGVASYQVELRKDGITVAAGGVGAATAITVCSTGCTLNHAVAEGSVYALRVRAQNGDSIELTSPTWSSYSAWSSDVTTDFTPPTTSISAPTSDSWHSDDFQVTFVDTAANSCLYQIVTDGSDPASESWISRTCSSPVDVTVGPSADDCSLEGSGPGDVCHLYARSLDTAGLMSVTAARAFGIDYTTEPVSTVTALTEPEGAAIPNGTWTQDQDPHFTWSAPSSTAPISGYSWELDSSADCSVDTADTFVSLSGDPQTDGLHPFEVRTVDAAGNCAAPQSFDLRIDATLDTIDNLKVFTDFEGTPIESGAEQDDDTPYVEWDASTSTAPIAGYSYGVEETEDCSVDTGDTFIFLGPLGGGSHSFWVRAIDSAGNCGTSSTFEILVVDCPVLDLHDDTVGGPGSVVEEACAIVVGPNYVVDSNGNLTLRTGTRVVFLNGFSILSGGEFTVIIDPALAP